MGQGAEESVFWNGNQVYTWPLVLALNLKTLQAEVKKVMYVLL